jgi:hypothetical protein
MDDPESPPVSQDANAEDDADKLAEEEEVCVNTV